MNAALVFMAGAALGGLVLWLVGRARTARLEATLEQERRSAAERVAALEASEARLSDTFKALSGDALKSNNEAFLQLAQTTLSKYQEGAKLDLEQKRKDVETVIKPIADSLEKVNTQIAELEKVRRQDYGGLTQHLETLRAHAEALSSETRNLGNALRKPIVRGRWGEIQLERVVEMAGMLDHCDFHRQVTTETEDGAPAARPHRPSPGREDDCRRREGAARSVPQRRRSERRRDREGPHAQPRAPGARARGEAGREVIPEPVRERAPSSSCCSCPERISFPPRSSTSRPLSRTESKST